jgi:hypothetical protein
MSEAESAKPRIAETFIAAYYLSIFFQFAPAGLLSLAWRWRIFFRGPLLAFIGLGIICLVVGVGLLLQRNWAKTVAVFLSGIIAVSLLVPFLAFVAPRGGNILPRPIYPWPTMVVHLIMNAAIVWYCARS